METKLNHLIKETSKYWWTSLLVGILAVLLGIWCLFVPVGALVALTYVFITAFLISGIVDIVFAISNRKTNSGWGWTLSGGIIDILFALVLLTLPLPVITTILVYFIGFWILFRSVWTIGSAAELNKYVNAGWLLVLGVLSLIFSFFYLISPVFGGVSMVFLASMAFLAYGIFRIYYAFKLKGINKEINKLSDQ